MKNTLTNVIARYKDIEHLRKGEMILPQFVDLHTSNRCNQKCRGCAYSGMLNGEVMHEHLHFAAVEKFLYLGVKAFDFAGGGEASLIPYLPKLMKRIKESDAHFSLITNGVHMPDELAEMVIEGATYVRFSLEASDPETYAQYKGVDCWHKVIGNIKKLIDMRGESNGNNLEISLKFSVGKSLNGTDHYKNALALGMDLGVDRVNFAAFTHEPEELNTQARREENAILESLLLHSPEIAPKVNYWIAPIEDSDVPQCWLSPLHSVMDWEGNIYLCCYYYYRKEQMFLGNIFNESLAEIWFSDNHKQKIKEIKREDCKKVRCKFFRHHKAVDDFTRRGHGFFL